MNKDVASFWSLVKMQLAERLKISFSREHIKQDILKASLYLLLFGAATAVIFLLFYLFAFIGVFGIGGYFPISLFNVLFYLIMIITTLSSIKRFTDSLFFSKDNLFLLTYPVSTNTVFLSKIAVFFITELIRNLPLFLPMLIAFGILGHAPFYYYIWLIPSFILVTLVPVTLASIFSIALMGIKLLMKKNVFINAIITIVALVSLTLLIVFMINSIPEDLEISLKWSTVYFPAIVSFSQSLEKYLIIFTFLPKIIFNYSSGGVNNFVFLKLCGPESIIAAVIALFSSLLIIVLSSFAIKPLFLKMAASAYEHDNNKTRTADTKNTKRNAFFSLLFKEIVLDFRTPSRLISNYLLFIVTPLATLFLNVVFKAIHTSFEGKLFVYVINVLLLILITCSTNISIASIYSRETDSFYLNKIVPMNYTVVLLSKLAVRAFLVSSSIVISMIIYHSKLSIPYSRFDLLLLSILFIYLGHMFWSAELDFRNQKTSLYKDVGNSGNIMNINELYSFIIALILSIIVAAISFLFETESLTKGYAHTFAFCILFFIGRLILLIRSMTGYKNKIGN